MADDHLLSPAEFESILDGQVDVDAVASRLIAIAERGETLEEIVPAANALRRRAITIEAPSGTIDVCGTGGDHSGSVNISTAVAIVTAACGVSVAKHGNRAASSRSGSADVMEALDINLGYTPVRAKQILRETGLVFLMAPVFHPALAPLAPLRKKIGRRTIFNLLGPLLNPANVKRQLVGVYSPGMVETIALALKALGSERAMVVHGNGMDELSLSGINSIAELKDAEVTIGSWSAASLGLAADKVSLAGGTAEDNARLLIAMLEGTACPYRDIVLLNTAAALCVADKVPVLEDGIAIAVDSIDSGAALKLLSTFRESTHER